jgi:hypothetical protein
MALWPYMPYSHMPTNMADIGVYGTSNKNAAIWGRNEKD